VEGLRTIRDFSHQSQGSPRRMRVEAFSLYRKLVYEFALMGLLFFPDPYYATIFFATKGSCGRCAPRQRLPLRWVGQWIHIQRVTEKEPVGVRGSVLPQQEQLTAKRRPHEKRRTACPNWRAAQLPKGKSARNSPTTKPVKMDTIDRRGHAGKCIKRHFSRAAT